MTNNEFIKICKEKVRDYANKHIDKTDNVFIVWSCKTLQNWKALVSTTILQKLWYKIKYVG